MFGWLWQLIRIFVGFIGIIGVLASLGVSTTGAGVVLGNRIGGLVTLSVFVVAIWYHKLSKSIAQSAQSLLVRNVVWAVNWALAPLFVLGIAVLTNMIREEHQLAGRAAGAYLTAVAILYYGIYYVCSLTNADSSPAAVLSGVMGVQAKRTCTHVVLIEGNICASKTTLCNAMAERRRSRVEYRAENVHAPLLEAFNTEDGYAKYSFAFQLVMRERRDAVLRYEVPRCTNKFFFVDRSLLGDWAFLLWNYIQGSIDDEALQIYRDAYGRTPVDSFTLMLDEQPVGVHESAHVSICLLCTPAEQCFKRLGDRDGVDQSTSIEYLTGVSATHYMVVTSLLRDRSLAKRLSVYMLSGNNKFDTTNECDALLKKLERRSNTVVFGPSVEGGGADAERYIPGAGEGALARYNEVCKLLGLERCRPKALTEAAWRKVALDACKQK